LLLMMLFSHHSNRDLNALLQNSVYFKIASYEHITSLTAHPGNYG